MKSKGVEETNWIIYNVTQESNRAQLGQVIQSGKNWRAPVSS